ncbi:MAG: hypothetical protein C4293_10815 [Nitrospiraceae bacterium]
MKPLSQIKASLAITRRSTCLSACRITSNRTMIQRLLMMFLLAHVLTLPACAKSAHQTGQALLDRIVPNHLLQQVDRTISFEDLKTSPSGYIGRTVMIGGVVLNAKRAKDTTQIEVLQLPSDSGVVPTRVEPLRRTIPGRARSRISGSRDNRSRNLDYSGR